MIAEGMAWLEWDVQMGAFGCSGLLFRERCSGRQGKLGSSFYPDRVFV